MSKKISKQTPEERLSICQKRIASISNRLRNAIHLNEMCEIVIFSDTLSKQIPTSYAGHSFSLFQRTLIQQQSLMLCTLWDHASDDRMSFPAIKSLIDDEVVSLAYRRSYDHWYSSAQISFGPGYEKLSAEELEKEEIWHKNDVAIKASEYVKPCIQKVLNRIDQFLSCKLIKNTRDLRNIHLAHHLDINSMKTKKEIDPNIKFYYPKKLLFLSLWCCHNLSLGLSGHNQNFADSFDIARIYNQDLWCNCTFDISET